MVRIVHVITTLRLAGAEVLLARLLEHLPSDRYRHHVVCLGPDGPVGEALRDAGHTTTALDLSPGIRGAVSGVFELTRLVRAARPDIVHTWMYHADLVGGLSARLAGSSNVVWSLHHSDHGAGTRPRTRAIARLNARLSRRLPRAIVCVSETTKDIHEALGYPDDRMKVIRNGFPEPDVRPDARPWLRRQLGVDPDTLLVGRIGRFDPQKDWPAFISAAGVVLDRVPGVRFVLVGEEIVEENGMLRSWLVQSGTEEHCHLLGARPDVMDVHAGLDLEVSSSSYGEAMPLVLGEALSCGVPVVATDVGDSGFVVGEAGRVVPPSRPDLLAAAITDVLRLSPEERAEMGTAGRRRVERELSITEMAGSYAELYEDTLARSCPRIAPGVGR